MLKTWMQAIRPGLKPEKAIATYEKLLLKEPNPTFGKAMSWMAISGVIVAFISGFLNLVLATVLGVTTEKLFVDWICGVIALPSGIVIRFVIISLFLLVIAKVLGGQGSFDSQSYLIAASQAPISILLIAPGFIPVLVGSFINLQAVYLSELAGQLISVPVIIYAGWLTLMALRASHSYSAAKALLTVFMPTVVLLIGLICMLALLGTTIGNVFNTLEDYGTQNEIAVLPTSSAPQVFLGDGFTLTHPGDWYNIDYSQDDFCRQSGFECLFAIGHPRGGANINLIRFPLLQEMTVQEADQFLWEGVVSNLPDVILESREAIVVEGQPAIKRIFSLSSEASGTRIHIMRISIVRGPILYQLMGWAPCEETFKEYQAIFEEVAESMKFAPLEKNTVGPNT